MAKVSYQDVMAELERLSSPEDLQMMRRFNVTGAKAYGVSIAKLRKMQKVIGVDDVLARHLWSSPVHEARLLGSMISDPDKLSEKDVDRLLISFDSWDLVDEYCLNLFSKSALGLAICVKYNDAKEEFIKRAAFVMMAVFAAHHSNMADQKFERFLPIIIRESPDERNSVKKAVSWALRQIGKRNLGLNKKAIAAALRIQKINNPAAQWIAKDALRELESEAVQKRLRAN